MRGGEHENMDHQTIWSVDELAANRMLADLGIELTDERRRAVARHFARHRQDVARWAAERAHASMVARLESVTTDRFARARDEWASGFRAAEHELLTMAPADLIDLAGGQPRSKGQILRALVRNARQG
jgi:hypothetical protein